MADNRQETIDALLKAGFDPNDLAALMGNIAVETDSTFDHTMQQYEGGGRKKKTIRFQTANSVKPNSSMIIFTREGDMEEI